jgi:hypothetical protein
MDKQISRDLIAEGECRRDSGMELAASNCPDQITQAKWALAMALLQSATGTATIDDATPAGELVDAYADGGRWRGSVTRSMVVEGYAEMIGTTRSVRPSRHRGYIGVLRVKDRDALLAFAKRMSATFEKKATPPVVSDGVATNVPNSST